MSAIVTLTLNPTIDLYASAPRVEPEHKIRCLDPRLDPGGGGVNVARAVVQLGGDALALFPAGGPTGELLSRSLAAAGVSHRAIFTEADTRESFTVLETATGLEFRFVLPGPSLREPEWGACLQCVEALSPAPEYLVASGTLPPGVPEDFYVRLADLAHRRGIRMLLDTSGTALREALRAPLYLVKPNRRELEELTGLSLVEPGDQEAACRSLLREGGLAAVALTLSADGALLVWKGGSERLRPPPVTVRSSVGAGDSFLGGLVLGLARGLPLPEAFCFGVAAGTAALLTPGTGLCRRDDTEALHARLCRARS